MIPPLIAPGKKRGFARAAPLPKQEFGSNVTKPTLYMLLGTPGSGKSFFASQLAQKIDAVWLNSDKTRVEMYGADWDTQITDPKLRYDDVFAHMNQVMLDTLRRGRDVLYDANNHKKEFRDAFRQSSEAAGAAAITLYIKTPQELSDQRAMNREVSPYQSSIMSAEKLQKHKNLFEPPQPGESTIVIDGTADFESQLQSYYEQTGKLNEH